MARKNTTDRQQGTDPPSPDDAVHQARRRRQVAAKLNEVLAGKRCKYCGATGAWKTYGKERSSGRVRYVRCLACGKADQAPVIVEEDNDEPCQN